MVPSLWRGEWFIKAGNYITLAELFYICRRASACLNLYPIWISMPIFIYRREHSLSQSEDAQKTRNAEVLRHQETGWWGLPLR